MRLVLMLAWLVVGLLVGAVTPVLLVARLSPTAGGLAVVPPPGAAGSAARSPRSPRAP